MVLHGVSPRVQALLIPKAPVKGAEWQAKYFLSMIFQCVAKCAERAFAVGRNPPPRYGATACAICIKNNNFSRLILCRNSRETVPVKRRSGAFFALTQEISRCGQAGGRRTHARPMRPNAVGRGRRARCGHAVVRTETRRQPRSGYCAPPRAGGVSGLRGLASFFRLSSFLALGAVALAAGTSGGGPAAPRARARAQGGQGWTGLAQGGQKKRTSLVFRAWWMVCRASSSTPPHSSAGRAAVPGQDAMSA